MKETDSMTNFRWIAIIVAALALVCRLTLKQFAFGFATTVSPGWHRDIFSVTPGVVLFWLLLAVSSILIEGSIKA
jgi:hypothetical protein